jgi:peptide-methionine (S)-S-oxide reductase
MNAEQEEAARHALDRAQGEWDGQVVTTIEPMQKWWPAEDYHQDYWAGDGQSNPYCIAHIPPKLQKLRKSFQARVKSATAQA